jgi:hypothetical protein
MANPAHVAKLLEGVEAWNAWRTTNPRTIPDLTGADLAQANLHDVDLSDADLQGAVLDSAILRGADLTNANLQGADLTNANLQRAEVRRANLQDATLILANLQSASLSQANLRGADLDRANLQSTRIKLANLQGANFAEANMQRAKLAGASLRNARLVSTNLKRSSLEHADLERANLIMANLEEANVSGIKFDTRSLQRCFHGIRVATCYGSQHFKSFAQDQDYLEELRASGYGGWFKFWAWWIFADCGRSFARWASWSIFLAALFGVIYYWMGKDHFAIGRLEFELLTMLYYSVVTFTTLGFGDITPVSRAGLIVVMIEVIIGYIMLGGLISILANKVARRA